MYSSNVIDGMYTFGLLPNQNNADGDLGGCKLQQIKQITMPLLSTDQSHSASSSCHSWSMGSISGLGHLIFKMRAQLLPCKAVTWIKREDKLQNVHTRYNLMQFILVKNCEKSMLMKRLPKAGRNTYYEYIYNAWISKSILHQK